MWLTRRIYINRYKMVRYKRGLQVLIRFERGNREFIGDESGTAKCWGYIEGSEEIGG
jgi:hypothetical protein